MPGSDYKIGFLPRMGIKPYTEKPLTFGKVAEERGNLAAAIIARLITAQTDASFEDMCYEAFNIGFIVDPKGNIKPVPYGYSPKEGEFHMPGICSINSIIIALTAVLGRSIAYYKPLQNYAKYMAQGNYTTEQTAFHFSEINITLGSPEGTIAAKTRDTISFPDVMRAIWDKLGALTVDLESIKTEDEEVAVDKMYVHKNIGKRSALKTTIPNISDVCIGTELLAVLDEESDGDEFRAQITNSTILPQIVIHEGKKYYYRASLVAVKAWKKEYGKECKEPESFNHMLTFLTGAYQGKNGFFLISNHIVGFEENMKNFFSRIRATMIIYSSEPSDIHIG